VDHRYVLMTYRHILCGPRIAGNTFQTRRTQPNLSCHIEGWHSTLDSAALFPKLGYNSNRQ
jgi:hypothetical protein